MLTRKMLETADTLKEYLLVIEVLCHELGEAFPYDEVIHWCECNPAYEFTEWFIKYFSDKNENGLAKEYSYTSAGRPSGFNIILDGDSKVQANGEFGAIICNGNLELSGDIRAAYVHIIGDLKISGSSFRVVKPKEVVGYTHNGLKRGILDVEGVLLSNCDIHVNGVSLLGPLTKINGDFQCVGNVNANGNIHITGNTIIAGKLIAKSAVKAGALTVTNIVKIDGSIEVAENCKFYNDVACITELSVGGTLEANGCLNIAGSIKVSRYMCCQGTVHAAGAIASKGTIDIQHGELVSFDFISSGGNILVDKGITCKSDISAPSGSIVSEGPIVAGGIVISKEEIKSGGAYGIFAGLNLSADERKFTVFSSKEPRNIKYGTFKEWMADSVSNAGENISRMKLE